MNLGHCCSVCEDEMLKDDPLGFTKRAFMACPDCGNKRCPRASAHWQACSGSNDDGQVGSFYGPKAHWPKLEDRPPVRSVTDVGPGDYVKVRGTWKKIVTNTAHARPLPRVWRIETDDGEDYGMFDIDRYAKAEDPR